MSQKNTVRHMNIFDAIFNPVAVYENQTPTEAGYYWAYAEGLTSEPWMIYYSYPQMGSRNEVWIFGGGSRPVSDFTHYSNMIEMPRVSAVKGVKEQIEKKYHLEHIPSEWCNER